MVRCRRSSSTKTGRESQLIRVSRDASAEYTFDLDLIAGENELRGVAVSPAGLSSHPDSIRIIYDAPPAKPALHVLTIGVSRYAQPSWNLGFARADAEALAEFFTTRKAPSSSNR